MADISKITLPSGTTYNLKDAQAREDIETIRTAVSGGVSFLGITTTEITDGSTTSSVTVGDKTLSAINGALVIYGDDEFVWSDSDSKWHRFGPAGTFGALAYKDTASASYKPAGTVSKPTFTGSSSSVTITATDNTSGNYTPAGTVSKPTFTGASMTSSGSYTPAGTVSVSTKSTENKTAAVSPASSGTATYTPAGSVSTPTITVTPNTTTVNSITAVGTLPSWTATVASENLTLGWDAGTLPTKGGNTTVATGIKSATSSQPTFTGTGVRLVTGNIAVPSAYTASFTGTEGSVSVSGTTTGSVSQPTFSGTKVQLSGTTTAAGSVSQPTFSGTQATITVS